MDLPDVRIRALRAPADERLDALYPAQEPFVFVPAPGDPLSSVRVFAHPDRHLHYVGHGLSGGGLRLRADLPARGAPRPRRPGRCAS
ncbi:MAG: hypothetical protein M5U28_44640 [Sandaracinaceae bacterium]|nr:hypothetical protein [Sandaracinaceae bacterium]